ncbi:hypothetical protein ACFE04_013094 [Oxalis oulophora]
MKTISCKEVSRAPISLSKAASILSEFSNADNGAPHAVTAYLRRSSAAFNELVQLRKELKPKSNEYEINHKRKKKKQEDEEVNNRASQVRELSREPSYVNNGGEIGVFEGNVKVEGDSVKEEKKKKKKRKSREIDEDGRENNSEEERRRKKKKMKSEGDS